MAESGRKGSGRRPAPGRVPIGALRAGQSTASQPGLSHDEVAARAYEIYLARGAAPGRDLDDWLQAERELRNSMKGLQAR